MNRFKTGNKVSYMLVAALLSLPMLFHSQISVANTSITARTATNDYDARGQFATTTTNALGHSETHIFDARFGVLTSMTGPNGLSTSWTYDSFGRKVSETRADATTSTLVRQWCDGFNGQTGYSHCPSNGALAITTQTDGAGDTTAISDSLGRVIRTVATGRHGELIFSDTIYNARGEIDKKSKPYFEGDTPLWSEFKYDALSRVYREISPNGSQTNTGFDGLSITAINALDQINEHTKNVLGNTTQVYDSNANDTFYRYDPFGNLVETEDADGNIISNTFDIRGRKIAMSDPDMGDWTYTYNALSELVSQTDAKGQTITMEYDLLGRMVSRVELEGTSTWVFDAASNGVGKLASETGPLGNSKYLSYDALGRAYNVNTSIEGNNFDVTTNYDTLSRVESITYPQSTKYPLGLTVEYGYSEVATDGADGYLKTVTNQTDGTIYWEAKAQNAAGQLTDIMLGNGINTTTNYNPQTNWVDSIQSGTTVGGHDIQNLGFEFDAIGNLTKRSDYNQYIGVTALNEQFSYDNLNRMIDSTVLGQTSKSYGYDALGNITSKTGVGSYSYGDNAGPHAVTQTELSGVFTSYFYDANGNMTSGNNRTISYTSYNKPTQITNASADISFTYGANRARIIRKNLITGKTRYYIGKLFEQETKSGLTTYTHYIKAGGGTVAIETSKSDHASSIHYLHKDHLGSITAITDSQGLIVEEQSYDPFGKRRNNDWTDIAGPSTSSTTTDRGFTGHEHIDEVGLVHMNGRVYDPNLGRFNSPDIFIQFPFFSQSFNRYSYVLNNPLAFTDPSGWYLKYEYDYLGDVIIDGGRSSDKTVTKAQQYLVKLIEVRPYGLRFTVGITCCVLINQRTVSNPNYKPPSSKPTSTPSPASRPAAKPTPNKPKAVASGRPVGDADRITKMSRMFMSSTGDTGIISNTSNTAANILGGGKFQSGTSTGASPYPNKSGISLRSISKAWLKRLGWALTTSEVEDFSKTYLHYGYAKDKVLFSNGLRTNSFVTDDELGLMTGIEAQQKLALPSETPPDSVYRVEINNAETPVFGPSVVNSTSFPPRTGGGVQYYLPYGSSVGSVTGPYEIPQ